MSTKNDGGPAFPSHGTMGEVAHEGMTLRDYFAAKAMAALIAEPVEGIQECMAYELSGMAYELSDRSTAAFAASAYQFADAMLRARQAPMATQPPDSSAQA